MPKSDPKKAHKDEKWFEEKVNNSAKFVSPSSVQVWDRIIYGIALNKFTLQSFNLPNYKMETLGHNLQGKIPAYEIIIPYSSSTDNCIFIPFSKFLGKKMNYIFSITSSVVFFHPLECLRCEQKGAQHCGLQVSCLYELNILCSTLAMFCEDLDELVHV